MNNNFLLAELFDHFADLFELRGKTDDRYRIASYRKAAQLMRNLSRDVSEIDKEGRLEDLSGVGKAIAEKIREFLKTEKIQAYEKLKKKFPKGLLPLMDIPSLGPKKVQLLWKELGVMDRKSLRAVLKDGSAEKLPGFGTKSIDNIREGLKIADILNKRKPYKEMVPLVKELTKYLKASKFTTKLEVAGSFRRKKATIGDIDFLAVSKKPQELIRYFVSHPDVTKVLAEGSTKGSIILEGKQQVDLRVVKADEWGAALLYFTGSKEHNIQLRTLALKQGKTINEYGIFVYSRGEKGGRLASKTEKEIYRSLGLRFVPPEKRTGGKEIQHFTHSS